MAKRLRPLSGLDAAFLYLEAAGTPMHVGSVMLLRVPARRRARFRNDLIEHVRGRLPQAAALRRVLVEAPFDLAHPSWREVAAVDLDRHIAHQTLPRPGSDAQLRRLVAELHAQMLPRDRPLWQFVVIDGLDSGEIALYAKIHHALLDGQGGIALAQALVDVAPGMSARATKHARSAGATRSAKSAGIAARFADLIRAVPESLRLVADGAREAAQLVGGLRDAVTLAPRTPFNTKIGPQRSYATATLSLADVKRVARHFEVSVNDVVMALCATTLREYLGKRGALPKQPLIAAMPVSLRASGDTSANNQVSMVQCALPTNLADPVERLRAIRSTTGQLKARVVAFRSLIPTDFPGLAAPIWATGLSRLWASGDIAERLPALANLVISNVPGPPVALHLAGAEVIHYFPVSIVTHGLGLNITVGSYAGRLEFGLLADRAIVAKPEGLARGLQRALAALGKKVD